MTERPPVGHGPPRLGRLGAALRRLRRRLERRLAAAASPMVRWEQRELEHLFALLVLAPVVGIPGPPTGIALQLLPELEPELLLLLGRARDSGDPLGELASLFEVV